MSDGHWMGFGFGGGFMWIIWVLVLLAVIWGIKAALAASSSTDRTQNALEILKIRYARGEISAEEYQRMRRELED